jgi:hypothetical protein
MPLMKSPKSSLLFFLAAIFGATALMAVVSFQKAASTDTAELVSCSACAVLPSVDVAQTVSCPAMAKTEVAEADGCCPASPAAFILAAAMSCCPPEGVEVAAASCTADCCKSECCKAECCATACCATKTEVAAAADCSACCGEKVEVAAATDCTACCGDKVEVAEETKDCCEGVLKGIQVALAPDA